MDKISNVNNFKINTISVMISSKVVRFIFCFCARVINIKFKKSIKKSHV